MIKLNHAIIGCILPMVVLTMYFSNMMDNTWTENRLLNEKVWSRIFRMVDDNGRHAKRCEGNRRESQSFAPRTIREMRGQSVEPECSAAVDDDFRAHRWRAGFCGVCQEGR